MSTGLNRLSGFAAKPHVIVGFTTKPPLGGYLFLHTSTQAKEIRIIDGRRCLDNRRGPGRQAEAAQDFSDRMGRMDGTQNLYAPATAIANQNVHQKNTF